MSSILDPDLPFDMKPRADRAVADIQLRQLVHATTSVKDRGRVEACGAAFGERLDAVRDVAAHIRQHTLDHLDLYLDRFVERATEVGVRVHFAATAEDAVERCAAIARDHGCRLCVKSKSMVTEEIHLVPALQAKGIETIETDLGEFIVQLDDDAPSHIVSPMIHKDRTAVGRAFERELGTEYTEDPARLTAIARDHMRKKYRAADLGITGANFLVAETGTVVICTNEGNADFTVNGPPVHIVVAGMEKVVPRLADLTPLLKLLARSATAQDLTVYTTLITGPRRPDEHDGPDEVHVILVDNGRTKILQTETRELLRCIRCGACLNACPVYRTVGGHAYGAVYSGPIGAVITPLLKGLENYPDLPQASSLCGACFEACPVKIDIPHHLVRLRAEMLERRITGPAARLAMRLWAFTLKGPRRYRFAAASQRLALRTLAVGPGARGDGNAERWIRRLPWPLTGWTRHRDFPAPSRTSFRDWWRGREAGRRTGREHSSEP